MGPLSLTSLPQLFLISPPLPLPTSPPQCTRLRLPPPTSPPQCTRPPPPQSTRPLLPQFTRPLLPQFTRPLLPLCISLLPPTPPPLPLSTSLPPFPHTVLKLIVKGLFIYLYQNKC